MRRTRPHARLTQLHQSLAALAVQSRSVGFTPAITALFETQVKLVAEAIGQVESECYATPMPKHLTTEELAQVWRKSEWTIRDYAKNGRIPGARKLGRDWLFPTDPELLPPMTTPPDVTGDLAGAIDAYMRSV